MQQRERTSSSNCRGLFPCGRSGDRLAARIYERRFGADLRHRSETISDLAKLLGRSALAYPICRRWPANVSGPVRFGVDLRGTSCLWLLHALPSACYLENWTLILGCDTALDHSVDLRLLELSQIDQGIQSITSNGIRDRDKIGDPVFWMTYKIN